MAPAAVDRQAVEATEVFRKEYEGYQKMAASDYLEHNLFFQVVKDYLKDQKRGLRVLDLGCGDAANLSSKVLAKIPESFSSYVGVDMSESAIRTAQRLVQEALGKDFPISFHVSDMLSFLKQTYSSYDVVTAAFALHHLTPESKIETLKEIRRVLTPETGILMMIDPFRREGESLQQYRHRAAEVGETWLSMDPNQRANFIRHMVEYDIVEEEKFFDDALEQCSFSRKEVICRGKKGLQSNVVVFHQ